MAFTDHSDLFAAVHEHGINTTIGHLMRQRPSLFNYATILFTQAGRPRLRPGRGAHPGRHCGPDAMKPDIQCVRTHWIRGFMALPEGRLASRTPRCARGRSGSP